MRYSICNEVRKRALLCFYTEFPNERSGAFVGEELAAETHFVGHWRRI